MATEDKLAKRKQSEITRREERSDYYLPAVDISENEDEVILKYDMPGVDKEEVEITAEKNILTVIGNVSMEPLGKTIYQETRIGNYCREFTLPDDVDLEKIKAEMKNGVLAVKVSKPEKAKPRRIQIGG